MLMQMKGIEKVYPNGTLANEDVNLHLNEGEVLAIVGENGAGKSTIMKILYGIEHPTKGEIFIKGEPVVFHNPQDAIEKGIGMVQQNFMLFDPFTVAENVVYSKEPKKGFFFDREHANETVLALSQQYNLPIDPKAKIGDCSIGLQQRAEILKVLYQNAEIIIFDEPSAVLTPQEVDGLMDMMRDLIERKKSLILITHKLNEVMEIADRIVVMRNGKVVGNVMKKDTSTEELSVMMVGRRIVSEKLDAPKTGERVLEVEKLSVVNEFGKKTLDDVSMHVAKGEIVGIAGVSGNGQNELLDSIMGLRKYSSGTILVNGEHVEGKSVRDIRDVGSSFVPEDRHMLGSASKGTLHENITMGYQRKPGILKRGFLNDKQTAQMSRSLLEEFNVVHSDIEQTAAELSGGNLQKLIVAREMHHDAPLLIVSEPTRGVDIGAMEFIHKKIVEQRNAGIGVLLISSDLTELMSLSDRIYVMYDGKINGELDRKSTTSEGLGILMMGGQIYG